LEQIQQGVTGRHQLGQQQLDRVPWPLTSRPKGQLAQPLCEGFPVALGGGFDLRVATVLRADPVALSRLETSKMAECGERS
jgi:hypothetical protein